MQTHVLRLTLAFIIVAGLTGPALLRAQQPDAGKSSQATRETKPQEQKPQESEQVIDLSARLVNVFFTTSLKDKRGTLVTDLRKEDIEVYEDGKLQEIFTFTRQTDLPLTIAILIDISGSQQYTLPDEKATASRFLRMFIRPMQDSVAILEFRDEAILVQDFTSTMSRLERALDSIRYTPPLSNDSSSKFGGTSLYDAVYVTCQDVLSRQPGRHTIILLTDGEDTTSRYRLPDAVDRALRSDVSIYSIGIGDRFRFGINEGVLKKLSQETGGRAYFPRGPGELDAAFKQIEEDLRSQYLVAYYPSNAAQDGTFRKIEIRVPARKDMRINHRQGYYVPKAEG